MTLEMKCQSMKVDHQQKLLELQEKQQTIKSIDKQITHINHINQELENEVLVERKMLDLKQDEYLKLQEIEKQMYSRASFAQ